MVMLSLPLDLRSVPHKLVDIQGQQALNVFVRAMTSILGVITVCKHTRRRAPSVDDTPVAVLAAGRCG